jgi:hypothetical protein
MSGARFVCSDPDAGDFEFADVEAVLDALEAGLVTPTIPVFDAVRQSSQPVGMHPEIRAAWAARLRYRPPSLDGLALPELPSLTSLARSLPHADDERERRRGAYARLRSPAPALEERTTARRDGGQRLAVVGVALALALLGIIGWLAVTFATGLNVLAAHAVSGGQAR